jgi:SET domain-containing protein
MDVAGSRTPLSDVAAGRREAIALSANYAAVESQRGLAVGPSRIDGRGCFATRAFPARRKVAELVGQRISMRTADRRRAGRRRIRICDVDERTAIDAGVGGDATAFINHSCAPNLFMRVTNGHVLFFALRDIARGEELTVDYEDTPHSDRTRCRCGSPNCRGTLNKLSR